MIPAANFRFGRAVRDPGPDFPTFGMGRQLLYLRRGISHKAPAIFAQLNGLKASPDTGVGHRQSGFRLKLEGGPDLFARRARRGGLMRFISNDLYFGFYPRPVCELAIAAEAQRRGIPVAEPVGALVEWVAPVLYRGLFLTRALPGMTLWDFVRTDDDPNVRVHVFEEVRHAIDTMHRLGLCHTDLNLHNLFITHSRESLVAIILDLDKARLFRLTVPTRLRRRSFARLRRSVRKLDPEGRYVDDDALASLVRT
jgi:hypothetical protein